MFMVVNVWYEQQSIGIYQLLSRELSRLSFPEIPRRENTTYVSLSGLHNHDIT